MTCLDAAGRNDFVEDPHGKRVEGFTVASLRFDRAGPFFSERTKGQEKSLVSPEGDSATQLAFTLQTEKLHRSVTPRRLLLEPIAPIIRCSLYNVPATPVTALWRPSKFRRHAMPKKVAVGRPFTGITNTVSSAMDKIVLSADSGSPSPLVNLLLRTPH